MIAAATGSTRETFDVELFAGRAVLDVEESAVGCAVLAYWRPGG